jgi:peptide-methionine (R)-S-oxide reductase
MPIDKETNVTTIVSRSGYDLEPLSEARRQELAADLTDEEREVIYACRLCGLPLFRSGGKFESGTGWPSFSEPFASDHIREIEDRTYGMARTEIRCARCDGHLGHVFPDGPPPTGLRYCLNSASMQFFEDADAIEQRTNRA